MRETWISCSRKRESSTSVSGRVMGSGARDRVASMYKRRDLVMTTLEKINCVVKALGGKLERTSDTEFVASAPHLCRWIGVKQPYYFFDESVIDKAYEVLRKGIEPIF